MRNGNAYTVGACATVANPLLARAADRRKEAAIRVGLSASRGRLIGDMLTDAVRGLAVRERKDLVIVGIVCGTVMSLLLTRLLASLLYGVSTTDPITFIGVGILPGAVALIAGHVSVRRALAVDPSVSFRYE